MVFQKSLHPCALDESRNLNHPRNLGHYDYFAIKIMGNLGNPISIASYHFTKYGPSCKSG